MRNINDEAPQFKENKNLDEHHHERGVEHSASDVEISPCRHLMV
jgi:hypothetical protein